MKTYNLSFIGFGKVGRALVRLLVAKTSELRELYGIEWRICGVASRSLGWLVTASEQTTTEISGLIETASRADGLNDWLRQTKPNVVFETTSLNHETGQPAIEYLTAVLKSGAHAITANKGAVVYGYEDLNKLAEKNGRHLPCPYRLAPTAPSQGSGSIGQHLTPSSARRVCRLIGWA